MSDSRNSALLIETTVEPFPSRLCGRCRLTFPGDPTLHPTAQAEWWVCPPCRQALFGPGRGRS
jgi:hypothetical protein